MKLRKLELKDAPLMLEWMHDETVVEDLHTDFASKTIIILRRVLIMLLPLMKMNIWEL